MLSASPYCTFTSETNDSSNSQPSLTLVTPALHTSRRLATAESGECCKRLTVLFLCMIFVCVSEPPSITGTNRYENRALAKPCTIANVRLCYIHVSNRISIFSNSFQNAVYITVFRVACPLATEGFDKPLVRVYAKAHEINYCVHLYSNAELASVWLVPLGNGRSCFTI